MLPRQHILLGFLFSILVWILFPGVGIWNVLLVFLSSVFIDIDHYLNAVYKTGRIGLGSSLKYYDDLIKKFKLEKKKGIRKRGEFHFMHTVEFHILLFIAGLFYMPFMFILLGMVFHSLLDIIDLTAKDVLYVREFFFVRWLWERF